MALHSKNGWSKAKENLISASESAKEHAKKWFIYIKEKTKAASIVAGTKLGELCNLTGEATLMDLEKVQAISKNKLHVVKKAAAPKVHIVKHHARQKWTAANKKVFAPFAKLKRIPQILVEGYKENGFSGVFQAVREGIRNNPSFLKTLVNYAAPVVGVFVLVQVVVSSMNVTYALAVEQDGKVIAYVQDEAIYTEARKDLQNRIVSTSDDQIFELDPSFTVVKVEKDKVSDVPEVTDSLIQMSSQDIMEAEGLYIDGEFYGAVTDQSLIRSILDSTLDSYRSGDANETVEFTKNIELKEGLYLTDSIVSDEDMENLLLSDVQAERTYTIQKGDSPTLIADKNGVPYELFKAMNPTIEEECMIGDEAIIANQEPFLSVRVTKEITYTEDIPYETEITEDASKNKGYSETVQEGEKGSKEVTASVEYVNNIEESREILSSTVTKEPVTEKIVKGTKVETVSRSSYVPSSTGSGKVSGNFIWPVGGSGGKISCYYGSGGHRGLDIAASYGTPVRASAAGKVVVSGWYYSYGKCVVIDHGNGVRTLYGHNSSLNVSVGQYVSQGQQIAGVGSTGYSTGNHCHFEVQINGGTRNPLNYIG